MHQRSIAALAMLVAGSCGRIGFDAKALDAGTDTDVDAGVDASTSWEELQGSGSGEGVSDSPTASSLNGRIRIAPDGTPYLLYANNETGEKDIYLKRWNGSDWEGLGSSALPGGLSNDSTRSSLGGVAFDASSQPHVTWMDEAISRSIYYRYWNGSAWSERLGSATGRGLSANANPYWPTIEISPATGDALIAYETYTVVPSGGAIHLKAPAAVDWQGIDGSASAEGLAVPAGGASHVSLAVEGDQIFAAWQEVLAGEGNIFVSMYRPGQGWQALGTSLGAGGISQSADSSERPKILVRDGNVFVSWMEQLADGPRAYLREFRDNTWQELGASASGDGLSGTFSPARNVSFEIDNQGMPYAVWSHNVDGQNNIYAARWNGQTWTYPAYDNGSISATASNSDYPHVAIDSAGRIYVQWEEYLEPPRAAIYMRMLP